jgi:hypothetical protein
MNKKTIQGILVLSGLCLVVTPVHGDSIPPAATSSATVPSGEWTTDFDLEHRTLRTSGHNPYFTLEPGFRLTLRSDQGQLQITVLDDTVAIGSVMTRVVEEREWEEGELVEVSKNFFAICANTQDVFYFGEDVDLYKEGKVTGHEGAWRAFEADAKPGLAMPGKPVVGMKFYEEVAPKVALDRGEIKSLTDSLMTPAGAFSGCLTVEETSGLKANEREFKIYAPGVGLLQDEDLLLTEHGFLRK